MIGRWRGFAQAATESTSAVLNDSDRHNLLHQRATWREISLNLTWNTRKAQAYRGPNSAEVKLWDSQTGQQTGNLIGHTSERHALYRRALALALLRARQPAKAIETIGILGTREPEPASATPGPHVMPLDLAVTAIASQQLGDSVRARSALDQLRKLVLSDPWANDQEA